MTQILRANIFVVVYPMYGATLVNEGAGGR